MLPKRNKKLVEFLHKWCYYIKNELYKGDAGLQFSINTTNDEERNYLFSGSSLSLGEISEIGKSLPMPVGRKYALNFALADDTHIDGKRLRELFNPDKFMCKITPLHRTNSCDENDLHTSGGYELFTPYKAVEEDLKGNGFEIELSRNELAKIGGIGICDRCNGTSNTGYYVAVLNCWFCPKCYNEWYVCATHYPEDIKIENKNFEFYKNLFDL